MLVRMIVDDTTVAPRRVSKEMDDEKVSKLRPRTLREFDALRFSAAGFLHV